jgi:4,5-dihydroxyphthalate decarboxylase
MEDPKIGALRDSEEKFMGSANRSEQLQVTSNTSRRDFLKTAAAAAGTVSVPSLAASTSLVNRSGDLTLDVAGYKYDRTEALTDGRVKIDGYDFQYAISSIGELNTHVFSGPQTRDVTEIGLHPFMLAYANDDFRDYSLIPVFPLRLFRHKSVFIRNDRGIREPGDLKGRAIATTGYSSTSLTWIRGIFQDEYGISPEDVEWVIAAKDSSDKVSGGPSRQENILPEGLSIRSGYPGKDESDLLESGEVDALFHAAEPRAYVQGHPKVARLFPDYRKTERAYFANTGIFPIMHAVAIRADILEDSPWLAEAVFNAYSQAKQMNYDYMQKLAWAMDSLPWFGQEFAETRELMGNNYWSYGLDQGNRKALETLFRFSFEQGLTSRRLEVDELFYPRSLEFKEDLS